MFERKITKELEAWKNDLSLKRKAFVLKGLRQVGKTKSVTEFAKSNYEHVVYINFKLQQNMKTAFAGSLDTDTLITNISAQDPKAVFVPHKTVLILDEIQECSGARASLKSFVENDDRFDVIASGSLLGIKGYNGKYHGGSAVGYEHVVYMHPMDFEEFLWAKGISKETIAYLKECFDSRTPIREAIHDAMLRHFKEYICVGGMPAVVDTFVKTHDFNRVRREQLDILEGYRDDYGKHLDANENEKTDLSLLAKINRVYESIPSQLAKENKKFIYSQLTKKASSAQYLPAIQWLVDYGLIQYCNNLRLPESPLSGNKIDECFKLFVSDSGLFMAMLEPETYGEVLLGDMGQYKGAIYENIIADAFSKNGRPLYYFSIDSGLEIDFVTRYKKQITLIEVKAKTGNAKSASEVLKNKAKYPEANHLIKLGQYNIGEVDNRLTIPYYLAYLIND